jgi:hypothetical protein
LEGYLGAIKEIQENEGTKEKVETLIRGIEEMCEQAEMFNALSDTMYQELKVRGN